MTHLPYASTIFLKETNTLRNHYCLESRCKIVSLCTCSSKSSYTKYSKDETIKIVFGYMYSNKTRFRCALFFNATTSLACLIKKRIKTTELVTCLVRRYVCLVQTSHKLIIATKLFSPINPLIGKETPFFQCVWIQ